MRITALDQLEQARAAGMKSLFPSGPKMVVGTSSCGLAVGAGAVWEAVTEDSDGVQVRSSGCLGFCQQEPIVTVLQPGRPKILHGEVTPESAIELKRALAKGEAPPDSALCRIDEERNILDETAVTYLTDPEAVPKNGVPTYDEVPFFSKQLRIVMRNCGVIDPRNIDEYMARGGYFTLWRVLHEMSPEQVIVQIAASGLRGRGGAGFPTGRKWQLCREAKGDVKYLVCNADEGDPGAYMDRIVLEGDPHSVLEGMIIGAYAIGCHQGHIYVRAEYPLAMEIAENALTDARQRGLVGEDIMGTGFSFDVEIVKGAGAFVCGEETALLAAIEGRVGEPRQRPPYPAECGLWGKPTNINNVKTWANVPVILARGPEWFSGIGTDRSKGTMVFSLVGKVRNTGLVEVPMGTTLRELVYDIGGGIAEDKAFKAVQTGGPSGGCIPQELMYLAVDYEQLTEAGSMMGSGGMVVMDEDTCMVDMARYFLSFTTEESCGKCTPCREGTKHMLDTLARICEGNGQEGDIELLEELGRTTKAAAGCGLGATAPNPVLTTIRYFWDEYEAHIAANKCPGGVCTALIEYGIEPTECRGCGRCQNECPEQAISGQDREPRVIDAAACIKCGVCRDVCRAGAVMVT
jgi:NADH:ubiquinone oxidoreductase subunit F (NADH-binding)/(2Fe-2S) ferredoxin/Pyruvate/2-oxoacid:ferredoxin oxidoreductase delta subunit